ncbi:MAG: alpha/beta hydrolase [Acidimicrobiia bacterium]
MSSAALFAYGLLALFMTVNALRKPSPPGARLPALWFPAVLVAEAPWMLFILRPLFAVILVGMGGLRNPVGMWGLGLVGGSLLWQFELVRRGSVSAREVSNRQTPARWWERLTGWPFRLPPGVTRQTDITYAPGLRLDIYRGQHPSGKCLVYLHGGSWGGGNPRRQFRTVIHHLAAKGWVVAAIRYPLSPVATFPDHLNGAMQVFDWIGTEGPAHGIDPERVAIAGGSAGAHLASLAALGAHEKIRAAVCLYGVYDFFNRHRHRYDWRLIPDRVMKVSAEAAPDRYRAASPLDQSHADAPPFLLVHGTSDSLVPVAESTVFAAALEENNVPVELIRVRWGQHAFDAMGGARARALAVRVEEFLDRTV